jgi:DNA-binding IscR family transcriptional regulator
MIATRTSVALHIMLLIASDPPGQATSIRMAESIGTNPVVVRRIAGLLTRAGLISVQRGPGGATLARPAGDITLRDVWSAINPPGAPLVRVHARTAPDCPIGRRIPALLGARFAEAEEAMLLNLGETTLAEFATRLQAG